MPAVKPYWPGPERQSAWGFQTDSPAQADVADDDQVVQLRTVSRGIQTEPPAVQARKVSSALVQRGPEDAATGLEEETCGPFQPLLKASRPLPVGAVPGRYAVLVRRATRSQPFGLTLLAEPGSVQKLKGVRVAEDLPHLGIGRGDEVVLINDVAPRRTEECFGILQEAMSLLLVMQRAKPKESSAEKPKSGPWEPNADGCSSGWTQVPLAVTQPLITDPARGEFQLAVRRSSLAQRFGLAFSVDDRRFTRTRAKASSPSGRQSHADHGDGGDGDPPPGDHGAAPSQRSTDSRESRCERGVRIIVSADAPQLGLCKGDRLLFINGFQPETEVGCRMILERNRTLRLTLMRSPARLARMLVLPLASMEDDEEADDWLEIRQFMGNDAMGGLQEDSVIVELPSRRRSSLCSSQLLCTFPCALAGSREGAARGRAAELGERVVGYDATGGPVKAPVALLCGGACDRSASTGASPHCRPDPSPASHRPVTSSYPAVVCAL